MDSFFSALSLHPPAAHLLAQGELDGFAAVHLRQRLDEAVAGGCLAFDVDASEVTFVDAGGLGSLVRLRNAVLPVGGRVTVVAASPRFREVARIAGLARAFGLDTLQDETPSRRGAVPRSAHAS